MRLDFEICNFVDDNTIYSCGLDLHGIVTNLESDLSRLLEWLTNIGMVANSQKVQQIFLALKGQRKLRININENQLSPTDQVKLPRIETDNKFKV